MTTQTTTAAETIRSILDRARTGHEATLPDDVRDELVAAIERNLYDGASLEEIYRATTQALTARIERDPAFGHIAADVFRQRYYWEVIGERLTGFELDEAYRATFVANVERAVEAELLDDRMTDRFDLRALADYLAIERDEHFSYMAMETLSQRYFLKTASDGDHLELPQAFWMRVAMGLALEEDDPQARAMEFYDVLSNLEFTPSTPTLFHSGTTHPQLSSCYLTTVQDDLEHIFESYKHQAQLSKWSGGLGTDWTNLRASGALIESTGVESTGIVPFLRIGNDVTAAINRSGKRRGAACAYLACWHLDFPAFLDLKRNTGDERRRTPDMNTAAWIPDLFVERVENGESWTLFSPDETPELHDLSGAAFEERYREYERRAENGQLRQYERVDAEELWRDLLTRLFETGHPWITFKDPCNLRSPQDHVGTIHSSNLCTEVTLNTSADEHAVCNLGSVNLATHIADGELDREHLAATIETAMRMLDNVVDLCFYPTDQAARANSRHRPVGLGVMGFHDALMELEVPMNAEAAVEKANRWQEFVSYHAIFNSARLAAERDTYESYEGSKWDRGLLPQDTVDRLEAERGRPIPTDREETLDWSIVREHVAEHGMRNSNVMAVAPTATISTINGTTPSIQPIYSNLYVKSNMSGDFTVVNEHLVSDLKDRDLWDAEMIDRIKYHDGSVQEIDAIPSSLRERYRNAFEIDPRHQLRLTAHRQTWIDQSVSHTVFFPSTDGTLLDDVYRTAWELGLKTTYYLRTLGASQIEKSTLDMDEYGNTQHRSAPGSDGRTVGETDADDVDGGTTDDDPDGGTIDGDPDGGTTDGDTDLCTVEDPTCDACQ
ncbi:ribonucleoside-diphosphate reductase, adenosylcobalamin-dependent/ribonucleoside-diphosphate reductase, alpha subunit [Halovivax ruber XH-70]|uniref:Vitamin B12-dependent ribonucleotide reductase n=1 Tax=Halovivax ruber (strain DSM 18193 / JCM 13892 / XH-70) TaxID=797302 RepID=L0IEY9_HALRX|nr:ribonucleoside-diphosphate reductase subunit alpha [Halovivax ruber]AGB17309.1 ribonucleoside-diphosphate reductase, adenosylcobalamin-dependent/ribonucleoside-diphosphate reductase, alpha subunit [Halovivax ruber XH-70]